MKHNPIVEQYLYDIQESTAAAAAYAAGKTIHTIAKPILKYGGKAIKAVGSAGVEYAKRKLKAYRNRPKGKYKAPKKQGTVGAMVQGLRGKDA